MSEADIMKKLEEMHADLRKGLAAWQEAAAATRARDAGRPAQVDRQQGGGILFPNYGRSKGMPVAGASRQDLDFYRSGCERSLNDPSKARWHEKEKQLLEAIDAEIARQDEGADDDARQRQESGQFDDVPPPGDDDAPF